MDGTDTQPARSGWRYVSKRRAFLTHLAISATVVGSICALIFFVWYPAPYFAAKGAWNVLRVLIGVDLVVGPMLTLILFSPGKRGLGIDVTMIAMIQLAALVYGTSVIYQERPYFAVFAVDRFEVLSKREVDAASVAGSPFADKPTIGPVLAYADVPSDPAQFQRLLEETLFENKPDIERRPEFWSPYEANRAAVLARAHPLSELVKQRPDAAALIAKASERLNRDPAALLYVPVVRVDGAATFVLDPDSALPLMALEIDPWQT